MRRKTKAFLILSLVLMLLGGSVVYIILAPGRWTREIVQYINESLLVDSGWDLSVGNLKGQLTSDILLENLYLRNSDRSIVFFCETGDLNLDFTQIASGNWALSRLSLDNMLVTLKEDESASDYSIEFIEQLSRNGLRVKEFSVNRSSILIKDGLTEKLYSFDLAALLQSDDNMLSMTIESGTFQDFQTGTEVSVYSGEARMGATIVKANAMVGTINGYQVMLTGSTSINQEKNVSLQIAVKHLFLEDFPSLRLVDLLSTETVNVELELESDETSAYVEAKLHNSEDSELLANFGSRLEFDGNDIRLSESEIDIKDARFSGNGRFDDDSEELSLDIYVSTLDLEKFGLSARPTNIQGTMAVNIGINQKKDITGISTRVSLKNDSDASPDFVGVSGRIDYGDGFLSVPDSLTINFGLGTVQAHGEIDLDRKETDLVLVLQEADLSVVASFAGIEGSPEGLAYGTVHLSGFLDDPSLKGNITINKGSYGKVAVSSLKSSFMINSILKTRHGSLTASAENTILGDLNVDGGSFNLYFMGDTVLIANADVTSGDEYLRLSGKIIDFESLQIDQVQSSLKEQFVSSVAPFAINLEEKMLKIGPAQFRINEGLFDTELEFSGGLLKNGEFKMVNIDLEGIENLLGRTFRLTGTAFADFSAKTVDDELFLNGSFQARDGFWEGMKFDDLLFTAELDGEHVIIREMQLRRGQDLALDISGFYTAHMEAAEFLSVKPEGKLSFSGSFNDFDLALMSPYLPEWWYLKGGVTGSFAMSGTSSSSEISFSLAIDDPGFSLLEAEQIKATGRYANHRLYFENLIGLTKTGEYIGEGYLPVDFDILAHDDDRWIETDPIVMNFTSNTSSMDFLSPYFTDLDSVKGNIEIDLSIVGTPERPVRNGNITISDGEVYYTWLDQPISNLNGRAFLKDNMLIVDRLKATSYIPDDTNWGQDLRANIARVSGGKIFGGKKEEKKENLRITGTMDMSSFFNPNFAFLINGENIYVRTLLGEIEGIGDVDLAITGRDTINITGDISPEEAVLRMEFTGSENYSEVISEGGTIFNYRLNFPISDKLFIRNSQIDAEVSGNMSIQRVGNEPYRYAGELDVVSGKFYYFSDVFNIEEGNLVFDPTELNPRLDIRATTDISGEQILVTLTGELDDPVLVLEHTDNFFSQEDLLQLLTLQKRFDGNAADNIGRQSAFLFGKFLENELEKSLARSNPLFDEFEIEGSTALIDPTKDQDVAVKVGTRLTSNLSLSYKRSFSLLKPNELGVEYRLNRNVSLVVTYDDDGQVHLKYRRKYRF
ncbi:MAG: translocation/assembly module TamB domain-containing protein [Candidatus Neomarinimicrobiota bacterium]|nr:translocation/assembly module TamB domain-containing protein [Candidatus Neomarinimicrobiota bacterium]